MLKKKRLMKVFKIALWCYNIVAKMSNRGVICCGKCVYFVKTAFIEREMPNAQFCDRMCHK